MQRHLIAASAALLLAAAGGSALADGYGRGMPVDYTGIVQNTAKMGAMAAPKTVGGAPMYPSKDIVDNAVNSRDHSTLVAAVKAAGLVDTLKSPGPFTVFAPTNSAFSMLPAGTVDTLLKPENKGMLTQVLTYHVVAGRVDGEALAGMIRAGGGRASLKTVEGGTLVAAMRGSDIVLTDAACGMSKVTVAVVYQS